MTTKTARAVGRKIGEDPCCAHCGGELRKVAYTHLFLTDGQLLSFVPMGWDFCFVEEVPAELCTNCGDVWFADETFTAIERMFASGAKPDRHITVPVYEFRR